MTALENKLMAVARAAEPSDRVPYAFEKRILARLADVPSPDFMALWSRALWRAAVSCAGITLLCGAWALWQARNAAASGDFSQEFETAVLVMADQSHEAP